MKSIKRSFTAEYSLRSQNSSFANSLKQNRNPRINISEDRKSREKEVF